MKDDIKQENEDVVYEEDSDADNGDASKLLAKIKKLKEQIKSLHDESRKNLDDFQRAKADFVNMRRKDKEDAAQFVKYANEGLVLDLIPALDSFDIAFANKEAWEKAPPDWRMGIEYIYKQIKSALESNGINQFEPKGEEFNPSRHDAVEIVEVLDEKDDHRVIEILQKGYTINEKVIRPAKVKIGSKKLSNK